MNEDAGVTFERIGRTAVITLNRPHRRNALDASARALLVDAIRTVQTDRDIGSVVLTGAGGHFCSGADLAFGEEEGDKGFGGRDVLVGNQRWLTAFMDLEKPVIAAVDGFAVGAGMSLALAADFVIAGPKVRLVANFARIGFGPDLGLMYTLPRLVGLPRAKEIVFSARDILADEALSLGLVQSVVPAERLRDAAIEMAQRFDQAPTHVLGAAKRIMNRSFETDRDATLQMEAALTGLCATSQFSAEAMRRFFAKEAPVYAGAERPF